MRKKPKSHIDFCNAMFMEPQYRRRAKFQYIYQSLTVVNKPLSFMKLFLGTIMSAKKASAFVIISFLLFQSCKKGNNSEETSNSQPLDSVISISGSVVLPTGSNVNTAGWTVNSGFSSSQLSLDKYSLSQASTGYGIVYASDAAGDERLMGLSYSGQSSTDVTCATTVLAMLMKMPAVNSLTTAAKEKLISSIKSNPQFTQAVGLFESAFQANKPLFDTSNDVFNEKLRTLFNAASFRIQNNTLPNVKIIRAGKEIALQNPGRPFSQAVGIYKDGEKIDSFILGRYQFFSNSIADALIATDPKPIEKIVSLKEDGQYEVRVRTGIPYLLPNDAESRAALYDNFKELTMDCIGTVLKFIPFIDLNNACVKTVRDAAESESRAWLSLYDRGAFNTASFSAGILRVASSTVSIVRASNECAATPSISNFFKSTAKFFSFLKVVSLGGTAMNTTNFLIQYPLTPPAFDTCFFVQGNTFSRCFPGMIEIVSGNNQAATLFSYTSEFCVARVRDPSGKLLPSADVLVSAIPGSGVRVQPEQHQRQTDKNGEVAIKIGVWDSFWPNSVDITTNKRGGQQIKVTFNATIK